MEWTRTVLPVPIPIRSISTCGRRNTTIQMRSKEWGKTIVLLKIGISSIFSGFLCKSLSMQFIFLVRKPTFEIFCPKKNFFFFNFKTRFKILYPALVSLALTLCLLVSFSNLVIFRVSLAADTKAEMVVWLDLIRKAANENSIWNSQVITTVWGMKERKEWPTLTIEHILFYFHPSSILTIIYYLFFETCFFWLLSKLIHFSLFFPLLNRISLEFAKLLQALKKKWDFLQNFDLILFIISPHQ